jgi:Fe-Mn family superoxide dismutase
LAAAIDKEFGSFTAFQAKFQTQSAAVQGSGWGWLGYNKEAKRVEIATLPNQDPLTGLVPLLGVDVWEHAYYLQYVHHCPFPLRLFAQR